MQCNKETSMNEIKPAIDAMRRIVADANRSAAFAIAVLRLAVQSFRNTESRMKVWPRSIRSHNKIKNNNNHNLETQHEPSHLFAYLFACQHQYFPVFASPRTRYLAQRLTASMKPFIQRHLLTVCALFIGSVGLHAPSAQAVECIVPAKPGGGMDGACRMIRKALPLNAAIAGDTPVKISYLPGGIGAVAWSSVVSQRRGGADTLVTFSGGSLLNLAQGKYGKAAVSDVRWLAGVGVDYGMIAVRSDAPYKNLRELIDAMRSEPGKITIGVSGTVGSQDWLKVAMIARRAGIDPRNFRFVALEGGGDSFTALQANHVQVISGDASEAASSVKDGKFRVLAVLSEQRLPGALVDVPTAREQGFDVVWPIIRGFYMSAQVSDADYQRWVAVFDRTMATEEFKRQRAAGGLYPFAMTGAPLTDYVGKVVEQYRKQSQELGLVR